MHCGLSCGVRGHSEHAAGRSYLDSSPCTLHVHISCTRYRRVDASIQALAAGRHLQLACGVPCAGREQVSQTPGSPWVSILLLLTFSCTAARPLRTCASSGSVRIEIQRLLYLSTPEGPSTGNIATHCFRQPSTGSMVMQPSRRPQACLQREHCLLG